jgi:hypothetical protein
MRSNTGNARPEKKKKNEWEIILGRMAQYYSLITALKKQACL